jgi:uncharacterized protein
MDFDTREKFTRYLYDCALQFPEIERLILFGSRARGDANERSDFDVAVIAPSISHERWARFIVQVNESRPTLCGVDLMLLTERSPQRLRSAIQNEGIVLYDHAA